VTATTYALTGNVQMRLLRLSDAERIKDAYQLNRDHLAPWEPERTDEFFTVARQSQTIESKLEQHEVGSEIPFVLVDEGRVIGSLTLTGIVRGPFLSAHLGYWVGKDYNGRGIGSAAVAAGADFSRNELKLHRIQAATLPHNAASQKILKRAGFEEIGLAPSYLKIAGSWQDHILYQRILY
jgi:ribosomal-protein-alanine N-acetyltransferase